MDSSRMSALMRRSEADLLMLSVVVVVVCSVLVFFGGDRESGVSRGTPNSIV